MEMYEQNFQRQNNSQMEQDYNIEYVNRKWTYLILQNYTIIKYIK